MKNNTYSSTNPIPKATIEKLYDKIEKLIEEEIGVNEDGEVPVDFRVIDRTRTNTIHYAPMVYTHVVTKDISAFVSNFRNKDKPIPEEIVQKTMDALLDQLYLAQMNLSLAKTDVEYVINDMRMVQSYKKERNA